MRSRPRRPALSRPRTCASLRGPGRRTMRGYRWTCSARSPGTSRGSACASVASRPWSRSAATWCARRDLSEAQAGDLLAQLTDPEQPPAMAGALLAALSTKGVVADELRGLALSMRRLARRPEIPAGVRAIDIVGTGGDGSGSLNISTGTALLTAACGVPVVKHGNRSVSSRCGSADVLEALGLTIPPDARSAAASLEATGFTFLFAPHYHPATARVAPVRAALGVRTVFNILGPLVNPAQPPLHLVGAFSLEVAGLMADTFQGLPIERAFVVHGAEGWDEPTPIGPFTMFDVRPGQVSRSVRSPEQY